MTRGISAAQHGKVPGPRAFSLERIDRPRAAAILGLIALTVVLGVGTALDPAVAALAVGLAIAVIGVVLVGDRIGDVFLAALGIMLVGYAFLGRSFAYLGISPLYLAELALPFALVALARCRQRDRVQPIHGLLIAFMIWGAAQTVPYISRYGVDALRDAVTWGYSIYAFVLSFILTSRHLRAGVSVYGRLISPFLLWVPLAAVLTLFVALPNVPGSSVPVVVFKGGDFGVHLAGVAAFVLLGLYAAGRGFRIPEPLIWVPWLIAVGVAGILNRGGLVAASMAAATVLYVRAATRWLAVIFIALTVTVPVILIDPRIELGTGREISVGQVVDNVTSVFGESENPGLQGTKEFRLRWWSTIVDYTIDGPYYWTGKGYGINLADADGFQPTADHSLRAPHNTHIEILARSGVPGLLIWILLQAAFGVSMLRAAARARVTGQTAWVPVLGFIFIYWLAALVNASFDPYLQGPQGGIWFWSVFGAGLAAKRMVELSQAYDAPAEPAVPETSAPSALAPEPTAS